MVNKTYGNGKLKKGRYTLVCALTVITASSNIKVIIIFFIFLDYLKRYDANIQIIMIRPESFYCCVLLRVDAL